MSERVGYYSLVRFAADVARGEARNVAVILVGDHPDDGGVRAAPLSRVAPRARQAGVLDALLRSLATRVKSGQILGEEGLSGLASISPGSFSITAPQRTTIERDKKRAIDNLYRAFVGVRAAREPSRKGAIVDELVAAMGRAGAAIKRNAYLGDFAIDVVVTGPREAAIQVLSFCVGESRGVSVEREAGHFLFGLERLDVEANAVVQPPKDSDGPGLWTSHDRVQRWLADAGVATVATSDLRLLAGRYGGGEQIPLTYAL